MNILAIDTSTKTLSLAVWKADKVARARNMKLKRPLSSSIMPGIQAVLASAGLSLKKLDGFAVGLGPGSFTSLRVGLSTVKGLVFATGKPVVGIASLDILAMNVSAEDAVICTLCDAKRNLVYTCLYHKRGRIFKRKSDYALTDIKDALKPLKGKVVFVGDGVELFSGEINKTKRITPVILNGMSSVPQAAHLAQLALPRFQDGKTDLIDKLTPLYLYPEHCQIRDK